MKYLEKTHNWSIYVKDNSNYDVYAYAVYHGHLEIMKYLDNTYNWKKHNYEQFIYGNVLIKTYLDNFLSKL